MGQCLMNSNVIKDTPTGPIEIVFDGKQLVLQFNCSCEDAMPMCNAACCRYRPFYNVTVSEDEKSKFLTQPNPDNPELHILQNRNDTCVYLKDCKCEVHADKPSNCASWHCSPRGVGEGITRRQNGWVLLPLNQ